MKPIFTPDSKTEWRVIPSFPAYLISVDGLVYSTLTNKIKSTYLANRYVCCGFQKDGKAKTKKVHHLVAEAFLGPRPKGMFVCHIDGNVLNNKASNLRYGTPKSNTADMKSHGTAPLGSKHGSAKVTEDDVRYIRSHYKRESYCKSNVRELAAKFGISRTQVHDIIAKRVWRHL